MNSAFNVTLLSLVASVAIACSSDSQSQYLTPEIQEEKVNEGKSTADFAPEVDILFVVDNSGSMNTHQQNLAKNIELFTNEFLRQPFISYHVGVITTESRGSTDKCCGKLQGSPAFVKRNTPDSNRTLAKNLMVGTSTTATSGKEAPFDSVIKALDPDLLKGHNAGFLRPNAALAIFFVTDAEDQSEASVRTIFNYLVNLKGGYRDRVFAFGAIIPTTEFRCKRDDEKVTPLKIESFLRLTKNSGPNLMNLCATDFGTNLARAAAQIVDSIGRKVFLNRIPDVNSIRVKIGNEYLANEPLAGWTFNPEENAIVFGPNISWVNLPPNTSIQIFYDAITDN